jgi:ABC-type Mn2+/Zn2+ transport system permease subunit/tetratricopeptide (TPR) repeat protein
MFHYAFIQHALLGALFISICCGIIGTYVVTRRRVFIAGGITHASLGGLGLGVFLGVNPTVTALIFAALCAVAVQWLSQRRNIREDSAIAVCWSLGMALGIIFIFLTPGYTPNLTEYLFGNILTISRGDLWVTGLFSAALLAFSLLCQRPILYVAFDAEFARLQGLRVALIEYLMTLLTAVTIVLSIRMIGIVLLLSVLTLPQMMANLYCHEYRRMVWLSCALCLAGCVGGLLLSVALNVPAGACIVSLLVVAYLAMRGVQRLLQRRKAPTQLLILPLLGALLLLAGCASNTPLNRRIKGLTTHYNIHFNGKEAYDAGLTAMEQNHDEEFSQRLPVHPVDLLASAEQPKTEANFDRAIEKCKKSVTSKSMTKRPKKKAGNDPKQKAFLARGEFNPYLHHAWVLSGKAQFYEGDFDAAAATFSYTARHFSWLPLTVAECHIWAARCQAVRGYTYEAETELDQVVNHKKFNTQAELDRQPEYRYLTRQLQREFSLVQAEIHLHRSGEEARAIPYLKKGRKAWLTREQQLRTTYLIAQLQAENGDAAGAYRTYSTVIRRSKDYRTQINARMARIATLPTADSRKVERRLNRMRRQARNKEYLDQIYTALGDVSLARRDTAEAVARYEKAVEKSTRGGMEKAVAALRLGQVTFAQSDYVKAQKAYSTAISILKPEYPGYADISKLSSVLDELQTHAETVQLQDSLLRLSQLSEEELNKVIDRIIADLKAAEKKAAEEQRLSEYEAKKGATTDPLAQKQVTQPTVGEKDNSWYFYNSATVAAGKSEFQRLWGARKPEDDWRRRNKTETQSWDTPTSEQEATAQAESPTPDGEPDLGAAPTDTTAVTPSDPEAESHADDPHYPEYYLAQIPRTEEAVATSNRLIEDGLYQMGVIINEKLDNLPRAIETFEQMEVRYPESAYRLETYYAIYLMYMRLGQSDRAEVYRQKLMMVYPESAYAVAVSDPNYITTLRTMAARQDSVYALTYAAYLEGQSRTVHNQYEYVHDTWPLSELMPKFLFLHALSYVQENNVPAFKEALEQLTALYPESDVSPLAGRMVKGVLEGRMVQGGSTARGLIWSTALRAAGDSTATDEETQFVDDPTLPHLLILAYATDSINQNDLLFEVAKFNFENYLVKDFDLEIIPVGDVSLLVIRGFDNLDELDDYHDKMELPAAGLSLPDGVEAIDISEQNFRVLLSGKTFQEYFEFMGMEDVPAEEVDTVEGIHDTEDSSGETNSEGTNSDNTDSEETEE